MADVTDAAFRRLIATYGKPDVMWTEFVSVDGLCSAGRDALLRDFVYTEAERPIVAQIFGSKPDNFYKVAGMIADLGFDGIDINMGCPDRNVEKQGGGAAMMKDAGLAQAVIVAAKEGGRGLPVSVKTRVGFNKVELEDWLPKLLETDLAAVTIHARTRKEMSLVPANWQHVKRAVEIRNERAPQTLIIGNGDVKDLDDARQKAAETGADGIMLGRAIFGNPWLFTTPKVGNISLKERFRVMLEHTRLFEELLGDAPGRAGKNFAVMKKHYKAYVNGFDGAKELRVHLMETENYREVEEVVQKWLSENTV
jgi:nifR3 family TIM-barrel protein